MPDDRTLPQYGLQLVLALVAAVAVTLGAVGVAAATVDPGALCYDDHGGSDNSGPGGGGDD